MRFRTPVCQMNEIRQISAKSQHSFHFLAHLNSKNTEPIFTIFTRCRAISWAINAHIRKAMVHFVSEHESKEWRWSILTSAKSPKINWLPQQRPLDYRETYVSFIICIHASTEAETFVEIGSVVVEIFGEIGRFLPYRLKSTNFSHLNLWRYWPKFIIFVHDVEGSLGTIKLLIHTEIFQSVLKCQGSEWRSFW